MTVKKKSNQSIEKFIDKGADVKSSSDKNFKNILIRIPKGILHHLDMQKKPWCTRTQWIVEAIHEKLQKEE